MKNAFGKFSLATMLCLALQAQAVNSPVIPPGKIAVFKAGTSDNNWPIATSRAAPCFVQVFDPVVSNSVPLVSVAMSTNSSVPGSVWINAHAGSEGGGLSRSVDRSFLAVEGYVGNIIPPTSAKPSTDQGTERGIVTLDPFTNAVSVYSDLHYWFGIPIGAPTTTQDNPTGIAAMDTNDFWGTGNFSGTSQELDGTLYYNPTQNIDENPDDSGGPYYGQALPVEVQNYIQAAGEARIIGGTLYIATKSAAGVASGIYNFVDTHGVVVPLPQSPLTPSYNDGNDGFTFTNLFLNWGTTFKNILNFDMNPQATIAYGADQTFGIVKFTNNAGIWQQAYYFGTTNLGTTAQATANQGCFGICVDFSSTNPVIYATTMENGYPVVNTLAGHQNQNRLISIVDYGTNAGTAMVAQTLAVAATTNECFGGIDFTPDLRPLIVTNPASFSTTNGGSAPFSVAVGSSPYTPNFQWLQNSIALVNQTNAALTVSNLTTSYNNYTYQCVVTNNYGSVTSTPAILTVTATAVAPVISSGVNNASGYFNANVAFPSVSATGTDPFTYQWYFGGNPLSDGPSGSGSGYIGSQTASLAVTNLQATDAGNYYLVVMNPVGEYASNVVDVLAVNYHPAVIASGLPASGTTLTNVPLTLNAPETGATAPVSYQWYECSSLVPTPANSFALSEGGEFTGTQTPSLTIAATTTADTTNYYEVVSNPGSSVTSVVATVTVIIPPPLSSVGYSNQLYIQTFDSLPDPGSSGTTNTGAEINGGSVNSLNNPLDPGSINGVAYSLANPFDFAFPVILNNYLGGLGLSNTMSGWYGSASTTLDTAGVDGITRFGAQDGDQSTGGVIDFGPNDVEFGLTGTNRAVGLLSTGTTGPTTVALKLVNNSGTTLNYVNLSFIGELWRNGTGPRTLHFGYTVDSTANSFVLTSESISNSTLVPSLNVSFPTASAITIVDGTQPSNQVNLAVTNLALASPWPANGALWLIWSLDYNGAGSGNGYAIDNLAVSATPSATVSFAPVVSESGASNISITNATLNFAVNPENGPTIYSVYYSTNYDPTTSPGVISGATGSLVAGTSAVGLTNVLTGLLPGTTYHYQIVAQNFTGTSVTTDDTFTTPGGLQTASTVGATAIGTTSALFNGTINPQGSAITYWLNYGTTATYGSYSTTNILPAGINGAVSVSNLVSGLTAGQNYHYQVVASSASALVTGSDTNFTALTSTPIVTTTAASSIYGTAAKLNGTVNPNYGATTYWYVYGTLSGGLTNLTSPSNLGASNGVATVSGTISGLLPATTYYFAIVATNFAGTNTGSILSFNTSNLFSAPLVATLAASNVLANTANVNATVNPTNDAAGYWFVYGTNNTLTLNNSTTSAKTLAAGTSTVIVTNALSGLSAGTVYYCQIVATNSYGGPVSGYISNFTTASISVPTVATLLATNIYATAARLVGSVDQNNGATTYWYVYGTNSTLSSGITNLTTPVSLSISAANATTIATNSSVITGLSPTTAYYYAIVATNINGTSMGYISNFTTVALSAAPIVTNLAPSSLTASGAKLNGGVNPNNDAATYWYFYGTNNSTALTNLTTATTLVASNAMVSVSSSLSGLLPNTVYYDQIMATNNYGMTSGYISNFTTTVPVPSVVPLVVQSVTAGAATLGATVNPNNAITGYWFKYGTNNTLTGVNKFTVTNIVAASYSSVIKTLLITGLSPGTVYYYQVGGTNAGGTATSWNNSFTTLPVTPSSLGNVIINGGKLQFSFTNASGASFSILSTTNLTSPWSVVGTAVESPAGSGNYQFTNSLPATNPATFYMWRQP